MALLHHGVPFVIIQVMIRTQISLTRDQMRALRAEAKRRGMSIAGVIRKALDRELRDDDWEERKRRALTVVARHASSGNRDISERHDDYLG